MLLSNKHLGAYSGTKLEVFLYDQERRHAASLLYLVSVNDIRFKPGSSTAQSSSSESKIIDSSSPTNVNPGAVWEEISTRMMKSRAPSSTFSGRYTTTGIEDEDISIVVMEWSSIMQQSEPFRLESSAVTSLYLEGREDPPSYPNLSTLRMSFWISA